MHRPTLGVIVLVIFAVSAPSASAEQIFFDRAAFNAALGSRTALVEDFEGFATYPDCSSGGSSPTTSLTTPTFTVTTTPTGGGTAFFCTGTTNAGDPHPTEGANALIAGSNSADPWILTFDLDMNAWAVAFDLTDAAENGSVLFSTDRGDSVVVSACCRASGNELFFGFIGDRPFNQFQLTNTGYGDGWGIDQVTLVRPHVVPEPASLFLLATGVFAAFSAALQRR